MSRRSYLRFSGDSAALGARPARLRCVNPARPMLVTSGDAAPARAMKQPERNPPLWMRLLRWLRQLWMTRAQRARALQVVEMQQIGERRFVALVRAGERSFLIGGGSGSVALLAELGDSYSAAARGGNAE